MANLDRPARRVADVNNILSKSGRSERLAKGDGYVYWYDGETAGWLDGASIYVPRLSDLTIRQYLEDHASRAAK
jgi:hypothetical protein